MYLDTATMDEAVKWFGVPASAGQMLELPTGIDLERPDRLKPGLQTQSPHWRRWQYPDAPRCPCPSRPVAAAFDTLDLMGILGTLL